MKLRKKAKDEIVLSYKANTYQPCPLPHEDKAFPLHFYCYYEHKANMPNNQHISTNHYISIFHNEKYVQKQPYPNHSSMHH